jgi:hypothetical protein
MDQAALYFIPDFELRRLFNVIPPQLQLPRRQTPTAKVPVGLIGESELGSRIELFYEKYFTI